MAFKIESLVFGVKLTREEKERRQERMRQDAAHSIKVAARCLFQFQAITQLYMFLVYIIPEFFADLDPMTRYYLKVLACYVFAMGEANWLCAICYSSHLPDMRDRPGKVDVHSWESKPPETFLQNGHRNILNEFDDRNGLVWGYCHVCSRVTPPRSHHCQFCHTCILRRDHHCHLIGACIGHYNQRYFVVFCFLGVITGSVGFFITYSYLTTLSEGQVWTHYVFPWTLWNCVWGHFSWQFTLLTFHAYMLFYFGLVCTVKLNSQMLIIFKGKTLYEEHKGVEVKVSSSRSENFRMVFGDYWFLNFLFPAQIIFKQRHDGMHYDNLKIGTSHSSVQKKEEDIV